MLKYKHLRLYAGIDARYAAGRRDRTGVRYSLNYA